MENNGIYKGRRILCYIIDILIVFLSSYFIVRFVAKPIIGFKESDYTIVKNNLIDDINKMMEDKNLDNSVLKYDIGIFFRFYFNKFKLSVN